MEPNTEWIVGQHAWARLVEQHPELGYKPGHWPFHNFLRIHRDALVKLDAIRKARSRWWIAHIDRFPAAAFDCATGFESGSAHA